MQTAAVQPNGGETNPEYVVLAAVMKQTTFHQTATSLTVPVTANPSFINVTTL